jgi:hypothetical protein
MRYQRKKDKNMNTAFANNLSLSDFIKQNKSKIYEMAHKNTTLNQDGKPTISKNDDWFNEDEWEQHFKKD